MKKGLAIFLMMCMIFAVGIFAACSGPSDQETGYQKYISDSISQIFTGKSDNLQVEVVQGFREKPYQMDGKVGVISNIFRISVTPIGNTEIKNLEYDFTLDGKNYKGAMQKSAYRNTYVADIDRKAVDQAFDINIKNNDKVQPIKMTSVVTKEMLNSEAALQKGILSMGEKMQQMSKDNQLQGEVSVRLVSNGTANDMKYYWYVSFHKNETEGYRMLIDATTGEVVSSNL